MAGSATVEVRLTDSELVQRWVAVLRRAHLHKRLPPGIAQALNAAGDGEHAEDEMLCWCEKTHEVFC